MSYLQKILVAARLALYVAVVLPGVSTAFAVEIFRGGVIELPLPNQSPGSFVVLQDNMDVTAFTRTLANHVELDVPFPDKPSNFEIVVQEVTSNRELYRQQYRTSRSESWFSSADTYATVQVHATASANRQVSSDSQGVSTQVDQSSSSDGLAKASASMQWHNVLTDVEIEGVNRTDPFDRLRPDGPATDLSALRAKTEYVSDAGSRVSLSLGDTQLSASNSLVNTGIHTKGVVVGIESADKRYAVQVGRMFGTDAVGTGINPLGWSSRSYRTGLDAAFTVVDNPQVQWSVSASAVDLERGAEDSFGTAQTPDPETNRVLGLGTAFGLFQDRTRLQFSWAKSRYDNPVDSDLFDFDQGQRVFAPGETSGSAWRHSAEFDLWSGAVGSRSGYASLSLSAERASPLFRTTQGSATADRRQWSGALDFSIGALSGRVDTTTYRNNLSKLISIHTLNEQSHNVRLDFDLNALRNQSQQVSYSESSTGGYDVLVDEQPADPPLAADFIDESRAQRSLLPASIAVSVGRQSVATLNGEDIILAPVIDGFDFMDQHTDTISVSATWLGQTSSTVIETNYSFLDIDQRERAAADRRDVYYGINHTVNTGPWSIGGRFGFTNTSDLDPASRSESRLVDWGFDLNYYSPSGVRFGGTLSSNRSRLIDRVFQDSSVSDTQRFGFSVEIGEWLQHRFNLSYLPSVSGNWNRTVSDSVSSFDDSRTTETFATFNLGVNF